MIPAQLNIFKNDKEYKFSKKQFRVAAILAIFVYLKGTEDLALILTKRSNDLLDHPGQISFPGGAIEEIDKSLVATALRETEEEINLSRDKLIILGALPPQQVRQQWCMYPFTAFCADYSLMLENPSEVEAITIWPLTELLKTHRFGGHKLENSLDVCRYKLNGELLWGATAMVVSGILDKFLLG